MTPAPLVLKTDIDRDTHGPLPAFSMSPNTATSSDTSSPTAYDPRHKAARLSLTSRIQALLPPTPLFAASHSSHGHLPMNETGIDDGTIRARPRMKRVTPPRKFLKIRIITWNMHESLPKGELDELLGVVKDTSELTPSDGDDIPSLPEDDAHPYHIVVVAGQECPSVSGLPMGIGAAFKPRKDKDKHKDKPKDAEKAKPPDAKDGDRDETPRRRSHEQDSDVDAYAHSPDPFSLPLANVPGLGSIGPPTGWTTILEDWFCNGLGSSSPSPPPESGASTAGPPPMPIRSLSTDDVNPRMRNNPRTQGDERNPEKGPGKGPYELLTKERLMGIYLAVFIKRDIKHLVRGTSKSAVTAGLIGGRVGNKGGVGISLNLAGTTFLFVNAHLAAHGDKVPLRLANLAKIKSELAVDDFLATDDPRVMAEDVTDRFDFTFLFGDLNFRLDVTRLHADWLIARQEYAQAIEFDQLHNLMRNGLAFVGFHEAPIRFPPTFKYDVLRTLKKASRRRKQSKPTPLDLEPGLEGVEEQEKEHEGDAAHGDEADGSKPDGGEKGDGDQDDDASDEDDAVGGEAASLSSSAWMSVRSKKTNPEQSQRDKSDREDDYFQSLGINPSPPPSGGTPNLKTLSTTKLVHRISLTGAAHKAKAKWLALVTPGSSPRMRSSPSYAHSHTSMSSAGALSSHLGAHADTSTPTSPALPFSFRSHNISHSTPTLKTPDVKPKSAPSGLGMIHKDVLGGAPSMKRAVSTISGLEGHSQQQDEDPDKGVYDSSSKKRVPSWCDRILWKSTVKPEPEPDEESSLEPSTLSTSTRPRTRGMVGQMLAQALRPLSLRSRAQSSSSVNTVRTRSDETWTPHSDLTPSTPGEHAQAEMDRQFAAHAHASPAETPTTPTARALSHSRSIDTIPGGTAPSGVGRAPTLSRSASHADFQRQRPTPAGTGVPLEVSKTVAAPLTAAFVPPTAPRRWRLWSMLSSASRDSSQTNITQPETTVEEPPEPEAPRHRRGDVVCLNYNTLDDRGMRRLEGRSDHRPVIGCYAVYI